MSLAVSDPLKNNLEETVAREFLLATGSPYKVLRAGLPPEPDQLCEHRKTDRQVGIEVVSVYYDQHHAKSVWMQAREKKALPYAISRKDSVENIRLLAESLRRIRAKSRKRYSGNGHLGFWHCYWSGRRGKRQLAAHLGDDAALEHGWPKRLADNFKGHYTFRFARCFAPDGGNTVFDHDLSPAEA